MNETLYLPSPQEIKEATRKIRAAWSQQERQQRRKAAQLRRLKIVQLISPQKRFPQYAA